MLDAEIAGCVITLAVALESVNVPLMRGNVARIVVLSAASPAGTVVLRLAIDVDIATSELLVVPDAAWNSV